MTRYSSKCQSQTGPNFKVHPPLIYAYSSSDPLEVKGYFHAQIKYKHNEAGANFYIVKSTKSQHAHCLLGATTAQALNVVHFAFTTLSSSISESFPGLFNGKMGKIKGVKVKLNIDQNVPAAQAYPFSCLTRCRDGAQVSRRPGCF